MVYKKEIGYNINKLWKGKIKERCNIRIIVLERFIDPRLINGINYSISPLFSGMKKFLHLNK